MTSDFIWQMEDVLALYEQSYNPKRQVICFDERPKNLDLMEGKEAYVVIKATNVMIATD